MKNQNIKLYVDIFDEFVKSNFIFENNYYLFNILVFKKLLYEDKIYPFLLYLKNYYYKNKYLYILRNPITYNQFNTVLKQICKKNEIFFKIIKKFDKSKYITELCIYYNEVDNEVDNGNDE